MMEQVWHRVCKIGDLPEGRHRKCGPGLSKAMSNRTASR